MKRFIQKTILFALPFAVVILIGIFLPTTPRASKSLLMAAVEKDSLLLKTPPPRIIFVGGSNLSFGLNSQMVKDSLQLNPINTAIHASIGIKFMLENTLDYVQNGDIVVFVPEYHHFYRSLDFGSEELLRTVFDVNPKNIKHLNISQIANISTYLPKYSLTKLKPTEYLNVTESDIYSVNSFNQFGDTYTHWGMERQDFALYPPIRGKFNHEVIDFLEEINCTIKGQGALLLVTFPAFQDKSFDVCVKQIKEVESELLNSTLNVIGTADRYKIPDSLLFNSPYHLNKNGVDYRTRMMINDIKKAQSNNTI